MEVNTYYKDNLKSVMQVNKKYTDDKIEQALELLEDYDLSSETITQTSQTATAPSDVRTSSLIEIGGNCVKLAPSIASDSTVAKDKSIPNNTFKLNINEIGGMSYKSENLIVNLGTTGTVNGLTFTIDNGNINVDGTPTEVYAGRSFSNYFADHSLNGTYTLKNFANDFPMELFIRITFIKDGSRNYSFNINYSTQTRQFTFDGTETSFRLEYAFQNETLTYQSGNIKPMLIKGSTAPTTFKQGFEGIRDTATTSAVFSGNLINIQDVAETTLNGITYSVSNGVVTLNNTATTGFFLYLANNISLTLQAGDYSLSLFNTVPANPNGMSLILYSGSDVVASVVAGNSTTTFTLNATTTITSIRYWIPSGMSFSNYINKPMLIKGSTAPTEYKPYVTPLTKQIPSQIQALTGYGWGINNTCYNYIDFDNKKFVQKVGRVDLGTLSWVYNTTYNFWQTYSITDYKNVSVSTNFNGVSANYTIDTWNHVVANNYINTIAVSSQLTDRVIVYNGSDTITPSGYLYYELATPVETDISEYLVDFNPVDLSNNYTDVEFVNPYNQDMPNTISFFGTIKETLVTSFTIGNETTNITDTIESDGWSASATVYNTRKTRDRERTKRVGRVDLGSLNWNYNTTSGKERFHTNISDIKKSTSDSTPSNILLADYESVPFNTMSQTSTNMIACVGSTGNIIIRNFAYTDTATFKTAMSGVFLYYELETPETTPLNVTKDFHYIDLASGETITFNNANNQSCHNTIRYSIMEEKV